MRGIYYSDISDTNNKQTYSIYKIKYDFHSINLCKYVNDWFYVLAFGHDSRLFALKTNYGWFYFVWGCGELLHTHKHTHAHKHTQLVGMCVKLT